MGPILFQGFLFILIIDNGTHNRLRCVAQAWFPVLGLLD